ncbi:MAG: hypothetical protein ACMZI2_07855 (plasmid) [Candidatus Symbiodolus clandestinus]
MPFDLRPRKSKISYVEEEDDEQTENSRFSNKRIKKNSGKEYTGLKCSVLGNSLNSSVCEDISITKKAPLLAIHRSQTNPTPQTLNLTLKIKENFYHEIHEEILSESFLNYLNSCYDNKKETLLCISSNTVCILEEVEKIIISKFAIFSSKVIEEIDKLVNLDSEMLTDIISSIRYFGINILKLKRESIVKFFKILCKITNLSEMEHCELDIENIKIYYDSILHVIKSNESDDLSEFISFDLIFSGKNHLTETSSLSDFSEQSKNIESPRDNDLMGGLSLPASPLNSGEGSPFLSLPQQAQDTQEIENAVLTALNLKYLDFSSCKCLGDFVALARKDISSFEKNMSDTFSKFINVIIEGIKYEKKIISIKELINILKSINKFNIQVTEQDLTPIVRKWCDKVRLVNVFSSSESERVSLCISYVHNILNIDRDILEKFSVKLNISHSRASIPIANNLAITNVSNVSMVNLLQSQESQQEESKKDSANKMFIELIKKYSNDISLLYREEKYKELLDKICLIFEGMEQNIKFVNKRGDLSTLYYLSFLSNYYFANESYEQATHYEEDEYKEDEYKEKYPYYIRSVLLVEVSSNLIKNINTTSDEKGNIIKHPVNCNDIENIKSKIKKLRDLQIDFNPSVYKKLIEKINVIIKDNTYIFFSRDEQTEKFEQLEREEKISWAENDYFSSGYHWNYRQNTALPQQDARTSQRREAPDLRDSQTYSRWICYEPRGGDEAPDSRTSRRREAPDLRDSRTSRRREAPDSPDSRTSRRREAPDLRDSRTSWRREAPDLQDSSKEVVKKLIQVCNQNTLDIVSAAMQLVDTHNVNVSSALLQNRLKDR